MRGTPLQPDAQLRRQRLIAHITTQPSLSAAQGLIRERLTTDQPLDKPEIENCKPPWRQLPNHCALSLRCLRV